MSTKMSGAEATSNLDNMQLPVFSEADNTHDRRAVAVYNNGSVV